MVASDDGNCVESLLSFLSSVVRLILLSFWFTLSILLSLPPKESSSFFGVPFEGCDKSLSRTYSKVNSSNKCSSIASEISLFAVFESTWRRENSAICEASNSSVTFSNDFCRFSFFGLFLFFKGRSIIFGDFTFDKFFGSLKTGVTFASFYTSNKGLTPKSCLFSFFENFYFLALS